MFVGSVVVAVPVGNSYVADRLCRHQPVRFLKRTVAAKPFVGVAALLGFWHGFMNPVIGYQMMASSTMYGNVKHWGGSNHLLVPTGLLQDAFADVQPGSSMLCLAGVCRSAAWLVDDFGGGFVRVDSTTSSALLQLAVNGADTTDELPPRAKELLASVNASGRYFQFYAARNYFKRPGDLQACALNMIPTDGSNFNRADPAYVVPAFELRRALALARERGQPFDLHYTPLPKELRTPTEWKKFVGPQVQLTESGSGTSPACIFIQPGSFWPFGRSECDANTLALQPPPSWLMSKLLIPYPVPLLDGAGDGIHCST